MTEGLEHLRWVAVVTYRAEAGPIEVDHHFEELEELQRIARSGLEHDREHRHQAEPRARDLSRRYDRGCGAALRPSPFVWEAFIMALRIGLGGARCPCRRLPGACARHAARSFPRIGL
jgi:hypothetical protein